MQSTHCKLPRCISFQLLNAGAASITSTTVITDLVTCTVAEGSSASCNAACGPGQVINSIINPIFGVLPNACNSTNSYS